MSDLDEYVEAVSREARWLVERHELPYDVARRLWTLGMDGMSNDSLRDVAWPIWLIWGNLTDRVEDPRGPEPGAEEEASAVMVQAASEWLSVSKDQFARDQYFDRWVYEECGYERP